MLSYTLVLTLPTLALAASAGGATWCAESDPPGIPDYVCLTRVSDVCFGCLGPIETATGDEDADPTGFGQCFCPNPAIKQGTAWNAIVKCINGPNPPCVADEYLGIFNTYGVECDTSSVRDVWTGEACRADSSGDVAFQQLQKYNCDGVVPTTSVLATTVSTSSSSSLASGTSKTSTTVATNTATTTLSQASSGTGSATRAPTTTSSTVPTSNAASNNMILNSCYALALALGGAAINAL